MSQQPPRQSDRLYAQPLDAIAEFTFDTRVVHVFDDMIRRSVPGYATVVAMLGVVAARYAEPGTRGYDLGCSLGAATLALQHHVRVPGFNIVAVDNAPAMIERCRANVATTGGNSNVELRCADMREVAIDNASVVVLNFTLQFLPPAERLPLLQRIHRGLRPGGALLLAEKVVAADADENDWLIDMHHAFKRANGYSDLEISQKRTALENVLVPETLEQHRERLAVAGFSRVITWFHCLNFAALVAEK